MAALECSNADCHIPSIKRVVNVAKVGKLCDRCYSSYRRKKVLPVDRLCKTCNAWLKNKSSSGFCGECWDKMPCSFEGCTSPRVRWTSQGFCAGHRTMWYRKGELSPITRVSREQTAMCPIHNEEHVVEDGLNRCRSCRRDASYRRKYGLTPKEVNSMLESQGGKCAFKGCDVVLTPGVPETFNIDHCHNSGKVRSILCRRHNLIIGQARESIEELESAIDYLRRFKDD